VSAYRKLVVPQPSYVIGEYWETCIHDFYLNKWLNAYLVFFSSKNIKLSTDYSFTFTFILNIVFE
jgi:hypothetical protein